MVSNTGEAALTLSQRGRAAHLTMGEECRLILCSLGEKLRSLQPRGVYIISGNEDQ